MSEARPQKKPSTIMVVDEDIIVRFAIADYLRDCGYRVIEAASGEEAMVVVGSLDMNVDIVLCDAALKGSVNGFYLTQSIKAVRPHLPVILAGTPAKAADAAGKLCDEGPILSRPYEPQILMDRIKRLTSTSSANNS